MTEAAVHFLVIGYGNPLRTDDGFGQAVARALLEQLLADVDVIACHQLTPELAEDLSRAERAVFVDASTQAPAGQLNVQNLPPGPLPRQFTHHLHPGQLLALAAHLYGHAPPATLMTAGVKSLEHGEGLTPEVQALVGQAAAQIMNFLNRAPRSGGPSGR